MNKRLCVSLRLTLIVALGLSAALGKTSSNVIKQRERNTVSLELEIANKNGNPLQRVVSFLNWEPNA